MSATFDVRHFPPVRRRADGPFWRPFLVAFAVCRTFVDQGQGDAESSQVLARTFVPGLH